MARTALTDPKAKATAAAIASTLTAARDAAGLSRPAVAERMGWPPSRQADIAALETGTGNTSLTTLVLWADALGYDLTLKRRAR